MGTLGMGVTYSVFHWFGHCPVSEMVLKIWVSGDASAPLCLVTRVGKMSPLTTPLGFFNIFNLVAIWSWVSLGKGTLSFPQEMPVRSSPSNLELIALKCSASFSATGFISVLRVKSHYVKILRLFPAAVDLHELEKASQSFPTSDILPLKLQELGHALGIPSGCLP